jgi:hypothetical protein
MNCPYPDCIDLVEYDPLYKTRFFKCENGHGFCSVCKTNQPHNENRCKKVIKNIILLEFINNFLLKLLYFLIFI